MKKIFIFLIFILLVGLVNAEQVSIIKENPIWKGLKYTGSEANLTFYTLNASDKKTTIGWLAPNNSCTGQLDKGIYNRSNQPIKDDKNKDIILKCETAKCGGLNCYSITLTTAQSVNIDDYIKLGNQSFITAYQNQSKIVFESDYGYNMTWTLLKNTSSGFNQQPDDVWVYEKNGWKLGADDTYATKDERYKYVVDSTTKIYEINNKYYTLETFVYEPIYKELNFDDICNVENSNCIFSLTHTPIETITNTYPILTGGFNEEEITLYKSTLTVEFTGFYNSTLGYTVIDPAIYNYYTYSKFPTVLYANTSTSVTSIKLSGANTTGTMTTVVEPINLGPINSTGLIGWFLYNDRDINNEVGIHFNKTFPNGAGSSPNCYSDKGPLQTGISCDFDGVNDMVDLENAYSLINRVNYTFSMWYYVDAQVNNPTLISTNISAGYGSFALQIGAESYVYWIGQAGYRQYTVTNTNSEWHHLVVVRNGTGAGDGLLYFDGVYSTSYVNNAGGLSAMVDANASLRIGSYRTPASYYTNGKMSNIQIYDRSLNSTEVTSLFKGQRNQYLKNITWKTTDYENAYYDFNKPEAIIQDMTGNGNSMTKGATTTEPLYSLNNSKYGGAYSFDGNDFAVIPHNELLSSNTSITLSAWFKISAYNQYQTIISKRGTTATELNYLLRTGGGASGGDTDEIQFGHWSAPDYNIIATSNSNLQLNTWYHVVAVQNETTYMKIYINGVEQATTWKWGSSPSAMIKNVHDVGIGRSGELNGEYLTGVIDEVRIFNKTLTASEINTIYTNTDKGLEKLPLNITVSYTNTTSYHYNNSNLIAEWRFKQNTTTANGIYDETGRYNASPINGVLFRNGSEYCPYYDNDSSCYQFDGINDYIALSATNVSSQLGFNKNWSLNVWVYTQQKAGDNVIIGNDFSTRGFHLRETSTDNYRFGVFPSGSTYYFADSDSPIKYGEWTHIIGNYYSNTKTTDLYINGVKQKTKLSAGTIGDFSSTNILYAGYATGGGLFKGKLDQIMFYNRTVTDEEAFYLASKTKPSDYVEAQVLTNNDGENINETMSYNFIRYSTDFYKVDGYSPSLLETILNYNETVNVIPNTPPTINIIYPIDGIMCDGLFNVTYNISDEDNPDMNTTIYINGIANITNTSLINGTYTQQYDIQTTGTYNITVSVTDGITVVTSEQRQVIIDKTPPSITILTPNNTVTINSYYNLTFLTNENATCNLTFNGNNYIAQTNDNQNFWYQITGLQLDNSYYYNLTCNDQCLNTNTSGTNKITRVYYTGERAITPQGNLFMRYILNITGINYLQTNTIYATTYLNLPYISNAGGWINTTTDTTTYLKVGIGRVCLDDALCVNGSIGLYNLSNIETIFMNATNGLVKAINLQGLLPATNITNPYWLNITDQRYNDTLMIKSVNNSALKNNTDAILNNLNITKNLTVNEIITGQAVYGEIFIENNIKRVNSTGINFGTSITGDATNLSKIDMSYTIVAEDNSAPGFQQYYNFTNVGSQSPGFFVFGGYYNPCTTNHEVLLSCYNGTGYERITKSTTDIACADDPIDEKVLILFPSNSTRFNIGGNVSCYLNHPDSGNTAHRFYTDYVGLQLKDFIVTNPGTYYNLSGGTSGLSNYVTLNTTDTSMKILVSGIYKICMVTSFRGTPSATLHVDVFVNDVEIDKLAFTRKLGSGGDVGSAGLCGLYNASVNDIVSIKAKSDEGDVWFGFENGNFNINRLN